MWMWLDQLTHWHWLTLGLLLLIAEAFGAGGFLLGAAIGSLVSGLFIYLMDSAFSWHMGWQGQILLNAALCTLFSLLYWRYFRNDAANEERPELNHRAAQFIGKKLVIKNTIEFEGRIQIADTLWKVKSDTVLKAGDHAEVIGADLDTLTLNKL